MEDKKNNKEDDSIKEEQKMLARRKFLNRISSFLNSHFQYFSFLVLFFVFWFSFNFIIEPKYEKISLASSEILETKKSLFISEYKELASYKKNIDIFESINSGDMDKISKMIPSEYSRDDLFTEFTYFLMKNNFNVKSISVSNAENISVEKQALSRRSGASENPEFFRKTQVSLPLPPGIGSWLIRAEVSNITYTDLKYLLDIIENNLKLVDVVSIDFDPAANIVSFDALTYFYKNK